MLISSKFYTGTVMALNDVNTTPVIADGIVYVSGYDGLLNAYELTSGRKLWSQTIETAQQPWVAGNAVFLITPNAELVCLHRKEGEIKWVQQLPTHTDPVLGWGGDNKGDRITWSGPIMAGDTLLVVGSHGVIVRLSPKTGEITSHLNAIEASVLPPIVARKNIYLLNRDAELAVLN